jgi:hypothetical protein
LGIFGIPWCSKTRLALLPTSKWETFDIVGFLLHTRRLYRSLAGWQ